MDVLASLGLLDGGRPMLGKLSAGYQSRSESAIRGHRHNLYSGAARRLQKKRFCYRFLNHPLNKSSDLRFNSSVTVTAGALFPKSPKAGVLQGLISLIPKGWALISLIPNN